MPPQHPSSTTTIFLDQPPSCLQFCPATPNNFVVGTYLLSETKSTNTDGSESIQQTKTGSLQLWQLDPETNALSQIQKLPLPYAVFDLHFHPRISNLLGIATSAGSVALFNVSESQITHLWTRSVHEDPSIPALFLAWMPEYWLDEPEKDGFAVTFSDGRTGVFGLDASIIDGSKGGANRKSDGDNGNEPITELGTFDARQPIEVWFVALASYPNTTLQLHDTQDMAKTTGTQGHTAYLFTGTDFGSLHTRRFSEMEPHSTKNTDQDDILPLPSLILDCDDKARHHTAGVTSILPLPLPLSFTNQEPLILTGSYDEYIRVYHATRGGQVIGEMGLGGGVWRLQLLSTTRISSSGDEGGEEARSFLILASCMHGGTRIVRVTVSSTLEAEIEILAEFTEHESMNYASDVWRPAGKDELDGSELRVISSSFYDRKVCVWRVKYDY